MRRPEASGAVAISADEASRLRRSLRAWYRRNARDLPWRVDTDAYRVWLSEVMLQQTQVETVRPSFARFLEAFPSVSDLAAADEQQVLRLWEGLGYYRRARQLHAAARQVVEQHGGAFPADLDALRALPGVGRYTAGAIASIAFDLPAPIVEANTARLYTRLGAYGGDPTSSAGQRWLWEFAAALVPARGAGEVNQALMELGALVCTPRAPRCDACPVQQRCRAHGEGVIDQLLPVTKRLAYTETREAAVVVRRGAEVLLRQCADGERWAGLWDFPRFSTDSVGPLDAAAEVAAKTHQQTGVRCEPAGVLATLRHGVTRWRITLDIYSARPAGGRIRKPARWAPIAELGALPLSVTGRKVARLVAKG